MSVWLDKVVAVPLIGIQFEPQMGRSAQYPRLLEPFLTYLEKLSPEVTFGAEKALQLTIRTSDGYQYGFDPNGFTMGFSYLVDAVMKPNFEAKLQKPEPRAYSAILERLVVDAERAFEVLASGAAIPIRRVGLVANASVLLGQLVPGFALLVENVSRGQDAADVDRLDLNVVVRLAAENGVVDRCHHSVSFDTAAASRREEAEAQLRLDWQRYFTPRATMSGNEFSRNMKLLHAAATSHFERFGERGLNRDD